MNKFGILLLAGSKPRAAGSGSCAAEAPAPSAGRVPVRETRTQDEGRREAALKFSRQTLGWLSS